MSRWLITWVEALIILLRFCSMTNMKTASATAVVLLFPSKESKNPELFLTPSFVPPAMTSLFKFIIISWRAHITRTALITSVAWSSKPWLISPSSFEISNRWFVVMSCRATLICSSNCQTLKSFTTRMNPYGWESCWYVWRVPSWSTSSLIHFSNDMAGSSLRCATVLSVERSILSAVHDRRIVFEMNPQRGIVIHSSGKSNIHQSIWLSSPRFRCTKVILKT